MGPRELLLDPDLVQRLPHRDPSKKMEEGERLELSWRLSALPGFGPGAVPVGLALRPAIATRSRSMRSAGIHFERSGTWGRGRDSNSRGQWPRRISGALGSPLALSSPGVVPSGGLQPPLPGSWPGGLCLSLRGDGDQPWDRTTFSRASAERYDHTSSLVGVEPTAGAEPAPAPYEGAVQPAPTSDGRSASGRVGRTRTSTDLRPRQVGYRFTLRPDRRWGDRPDSNRDQEGHDLPGCLYTTATREGCPSSLVAGRVVAGEGIEPP